MKCKLHSPMHSAKATTTICSRAEGKGALLASREADFLHSYILVEVWVRLGSSDASVWRCIVQVRAHKLVVLLVCVACQTTAGRTTSSCALTCTPAMQRHMLASLLPSLTQASTSRKDVLSLSLMYLVLSIVLASRRLQQQSYSNADSIHARCRLSCSFTQLRVQTCRLPLLLPKTTACGFPMLTHETSHS